MESLSVKPPRTQPLAFAWPVGDRPGKPNSGPEMSSKHRTHRMEKLARIYDAEILPVWTEKFAQVLLRNLDLPSKGQILDVACGTGYVALELSRLKGDDTRLSAIEGSPALLDVARKKLEESGAKGVFLRTQDAEPKLKFADGVYDLVLCNLSIAEMADPEAAIADFARVACPGGEVRVTLPLSGSFNEFFDIYREVLVKHDKNETLRRLRTHIDDAYPTAERCEEWLRNAGLEDVSVDIEEFTLLFRSSREFFFAPLIEFGPLAGWKAIAGTGQEMQDIFWYIKEGIDAYFDGRAFEITIRAGCLRGKKPAEPEAHTTEEVPLSHTPNLPRPGSNTDDEDPDTLNPNTEDFGHTLEGLPFIKPFGDVEDTVVPPLPPGARDTEEDDD